MFYRRAFERAQREHERERQAHERERQAWERERSRLLDHFMLLTGNSLLREEMAPVQEELPDTGFMHPDALMDEELTLG